MTHRKLGSTDLIVPAIGFGCASLASIYGEISETEAIRTVHHAIERGINYFDTSAYYGETQSETRLGKALKSQREDVILATKGGRHTQDHFDFSYKNIIQMCEDSLARLQTDWLDIYQLHDIEFGELETVREGIRALQHLKQQGKVRYIGVTGYPPGLLSQIARTEDLDLVLSYCHGNLMNNRIDDQLVPVIKERKLGLINSSVTHMGILTPQGPQDWHPAPQYVKDAGQKAVKLCKSRGQNLAEIAIQHALLNPNVDITLLGTRTTQELDNSIALLDRPLDQDLLAEIQTIIHPVHNREWPTGNPDLS